MPIATDDPPAVLVITGEDSTADLVIAELMLREVPVTRFDLADFPDRLTVTARYGAGASGTLRTPSRVVDLDAVGAVYYRRPSWPAFDHLDRQDADFARDQARFGLEGVLHGLPSCTFVNHPRRQQAAEYKPAQLAVAVEVGFRGAADDRDE